MHLFTQVDSRLVAPPAPSRPSASRRSNRRLLLALLLILALALALDAFRIWQEPPTPTSGETAHTWPIVLHLAHGQGYTACFHVYFPFCGPGNAETAQREPLPVLVFVGVAHLTSDSLLAAAIVNIAVHLATLLASFWLTLLLADRRAALLAAALWAVYLPGVKLVESISGDLFAALWVTLAVALCLRAQRRSRWYDWVGVGLCVGCAVLSRAAALVLVPVVAGGELLRLGRAWRAGAGPRIAVARSLGLFLLSVCLTLAPWVARNAVVFGRPIVGSTLIGYNLYRENYQLHSRNFLHYVDAPEASRAVERLLTRRQDLRGTENEAQMDAVYMNAGLHVIEDNPRRYLVLTAYRGLMLWFDLGVDPSDRTGTGLLGELVLLEQVALLFTAALGFLAHWRRAWLLVVSIAGVCALYMVVNSMVRYLVPVMPLTIALSAIGMRWLGGLAARQATSLQS